ncbi:MAG TPA: hypothetical protein VJN44_15285, partial [Roseateles sp.]|nr:hypothetical protein [Roseateles sp.]
MYLPSSTPAAFKAPGADAGSPGASQPPAAEATRYYRFQPYNIGRWLVWGGFAALLLLAPRLFTSNLSVTMLSQMGIAIIACLSYNILLGQGGMLSFGHAVYTGLGAYMAIHALNAVGAGQLPLPV